MKEFKMSKALEELIKKREELSKKSIEKQERIRGLNEANQNKLSQIKEELIKVINDYAESPSNELEQKINELERETSILTAKVAGSRSRETTIFHTDSTELASINAQIDAQARKEYSEYFNNEKSRIYKRLGELKKEYIDILKEFHDVKVATNQEYYTITGKNAFAAIHEPDFFYTRGGYRPLAILEHELRKALLLGEVEDTREFPQP